MMDGKKLVIGILAHVDAGKTTLSEGLLYVSGSIRKAGRVDHKDSFLDTDVQERSRGITIFSKQAEISWKELDITLLDTPGHVDFSAEMERTLQVLDYAVLVISGTDGIQGHVETLWRLLLRYKLPVFLFVNKMDRPDTDREALLLELKERLGSQCIDFSGADSPEDHEDFLENVAVCDEKLLERYLEQGTVEKEEIAKLIAKRAVFPCYFGSALKMEGVEAFLDGLSDYCLPRSYPEDFGARVYKIGRDAAGRRLTYLKVTGGCLKVKQSLSGEDGAWEEKIEQIRIYSGVKYTTVQEAVAGTVCAVTGLEKTHSGEGLGFEKESLSPVLAPVLTYRVNIPADRDVHTVYKDLCKLEEEEPQLHVLWRAETGEIHVQLMGEVQTEILKNLIKERFGVAVEFDVGSIVYKETIQTIVEGVGHYEPLRHYAEVHLLMEPGEAGSGLVFDTACSEDELDRNWQRLVLTHLEEKEHLGILTGSPITDMKITLVAGRAHLKHTEGGDFRQATYRAVRHGLHRAQCVLLEPVYEFRLELPSSMIGRAMTDIQAMHGKFEAPLTQGETVVLTGTAPVAAMRGYQTEVISYSGGSGRLFCSLKGYEPCHNTEEVIAAVGYDADRDLDNPASSVFCSHGAGHVVEWQEVEEYMHIESAFRETLAGRKETPTDRKGNYDTSVSCERAFSLAEEKELEEIFNRTYGTGNRDGLDRKQSKHQYPGDPKVIRAKQETFEDREVRKPIQKEDYLLVDGYNIIFAWEELSELAEDNLDGARGRLMDILSNYQGYRKMTLILVFDAYKVRGGLGSVSTYHNIHVVYTKEAETADQYIEKVTHEIGRKHRVTVATSDGLEQMIIMGQGAKRMSAAELKEEIMSTNQELRELILNRKTADKQYLFDEVPKDLAEHIEEVRLGKKEF